ncbi:hypothetical protein AnigIFM56816_011526 [Aspergillus niger]|uniref:FAD-binding PCMH-type domain-containing protein n=1 Tax=Aspergillus niger TaxID=5061 RepID=A0A9W6EED2_ASPNG|nr:CAZyme family AA7 [Aspergillus niger]KAI2912118.1 CAZyme family AA7 [Aspergillus niger]KAI2995275.1 CAZyme family AA7 [Aspergillus niger]GKZ85558.1 hypothetical protein AnigIFM56816_011526 [Aspergillus niger]GLA55103.1 hypothetical protein AnigIFM63604_001592 [Aspergillus niger]
MATQQLILGLLAIANHSLFSTNPSSTCKVLPGDADWPQSDQWASLNATLAGRLIAAVPLASVCHDVPFNNYDADLCAELQDIWNKTKLSHIDSPSEVLNMYFKNYTCDPFTPRSQPCELGNSVSYVIDVRSTEDVRAGIDFAKKHNIRLVIKNTGHDYAGKSTGKGGLSLWTHNLNSTEYIPKYKSSYYNGPAIKLGAGVQGFEAYAAANATGHRIVGGVCPTVGIAGGFSLGGGHSILSNSHGMGSDNVLEWEVVTMDGRHLVATPEQNSDLYWALSGSGPGAFAVVLSMTARLHVDSIIGGATLAFDDSKVGNDKFWDAIGRFHELLPPFVDAGNSFLYTLTNHAFYCFAATMPGADLNLANSLMKPFLDDLADRGIEYQYSPRVSRNFQEHFSVHLGSSPEGLIDFATFSGSRIIPREMVTDQAKNRVITELLRNASLVDGYSPMPCESLNVKWQSHPDNAVHPAWRDALLFCVTSGHWDPTASPAEMARRQEFAVNVMQPMLDRATPGGAVYLNEANYKQHNWQEEMYGSNYDRLLQIKNKYDPESLLYAKTGVGSDAWFENTDGRLCRTEGHQQSLLGFSQFIL